MIENRNILCISNPLWESDYAKTIVELMSVFARGNKVLYIDTPYTVKDIVQGVIKGKKDIPYKKVFGLQKRVKTIQLPEGKVYVMTPPMALTINFLPKGKLYDFLLGFNGWMVRRSIKKYLIRLNMTEKLINIVAFNPALGVVNGRKFNENLLIYHCYDVIESANWLKKHGEYLENRLMKMADAVIVTSEGLLERKKHLTKNCFLVKNAANIELFSQGFKEEIPEKKCVGYIGSIDERLDYELLAFIIENMPDTDFVFVGRILDKKGESILRKYTNVILEGAKSVKELPAYLKTFSLGIIPFLKNDFNKGIYPLKINEYLAAGLPVVTTDFSNLNEFQAVVSIVDSKENFLQSLLHELQTDNLAKKLERRTFAQSNSWENRVEQFSTIIETLEAAKP